MAKCGVVERSSKAVCNLKHPSTDSGYVVHIDDSSPGLEIHWRQVKPNGVTPTQRTVLRLLYQAPGNQACLGGDYHNSIKALIKRGLVKVISRTRVGRTVIIDCVLTEDGSILAQELAVT